MAGVLTAIVVIVAAGAATILLSRHNAAAHAGARPPAGAAPHKAATIGARTLAAEAAVRAQAVAWVDSQVSHNAIVACDPLMCGALSHGFPAGNLEVLTPTAADPLGSDLVIATADLRSQFGSQLATVYAPQVIASFGTGSARITIRVTAADGAGKYFAALRKDLANRIRFGKALLRNRNIRVSARARRQLAAGQVDSRLLACIAFLAHQRRIDIVGFGSLAPGAGPGVPLRFTDLATADAAARLHGARYVRSLLVVLRSMVRLYRPMSESNVRLAGGRAVLRVQVAAPSPLGVLNSRGQR